MKIGILSVVAATLIAFGAPAEGKGPTKLTITVWGSTMRFVVRAGDDSPTWSMIALDKMMESAGFFDLGVIGSVTAARAAFATLDGVPTPDHGPWFHLTWTIPSAYRSRHLVQYLYPYAAGGPLFYTPATQVLSDGTTVSGWHRAGADLINVLQHIGIPSRHMRSRSDGAASKSRLVIIADRFQRW